MGLKGFRDGSFSSHALTSLGVEKAFFGNKAANVKKEL